MKEYMGRNTKKKPPKVSVNHILVYCDYFGIDKRERFEYACEFRCGNNIQDIHHISARGMGGSVSKDYIENLMAVCRDCHKKCENELISRDEQKKIHADTMREGLHRY